MHTPIHQRQVNLLPLIDTFLLITSVIVESIFPNLDDNLDDVEALMFGSENNENEKSELEIYLAEPVERRNINPISWWKTHEESLPRLAQMARDYFATPATSVPSEQAFSIAGDLISKKRNRMAPETANELMSLKSWYGLGEIAEDELSEEINATTEMENEREDNLEIEMIENNLSS